ncbi:MAG: alpha/beta hydrolase [Alphaproteobacteria bacterium]|nr:alpha/beta hydrolase [Alphaproteobacteria bacterium]
MSKLIILVHGMGRGPLSLALLAWRLKRAGYRTHLFYYLATFEKFDVCAERLARFITHRTAGQDYAFIGHSLGTVLLRAALPQLPRLPKASFLIAPPTLACQFALRLKNFWLYRWLTQEMGQRLADPNFMASLPVPPNSHIFAGDAGPRWSWWPCGNAPNDGILTIAETRLPDVPHTVLPAVHSFIMNRPEIAAAILARLDKATTV